MGRRTGDEDVRTQHSRTGGAASSPTADGGGEYRLTALGETAANDRTSEGRAALQNLLLRDDGWLRAVPDGEGKTCYFKWKFNRGRFAGAYVMVVMPPYDALDAFRMLAAKIENCYGGVRKPTRDKAYDADFDDSFPG